MSDKRKRWRRPVWVKASVALAVGALLCGLGHFWLANAPAAIEDARYLVFRRHLDAGHPLQFADLKMLPAHSLASPPAGAVTDQDLVALRGASTAVPVAEGRVVTFESLQLRGDGVRLGRKVPLGMRAFPIPFEPSLHLQASDCIDLLSTSSSDDASSVALVEGAMVLSVQAGAQGPEALVALSPDEVALVEKVLQTGKLKVSLRNPDETPPHHRARRRGRSPKRSSKRIEIWSEENG